MLQRLAFLLLPVLALNTYGESLDTHSKVSSELKFASGPEVVATIPFKDKSFVCVYQRVRGKSAIQAGTLTKSGQFIRAFRKKLRILKSRSKAAQSYALRQGIKRKIKKYLSLRKDLDTRCNGQSIGSSSSSSSSASNFPVQLANSLSQWGITWTFDREYPVGLFANGDWWVVGPVVVTQVNPSPAVVDDTFRNGSMVNPPAGSNNQAFDSRASQYNSDLKVDFPLTLLPNQSLISSVSLGDNELVSDKKLRTAAVLTAVAEPLESDRFFRPAYVGNTKTLYDATLLRKDLLPGLQPPASAPEMNDVIKKFQRVWLDHVSGWSGKTIFPIENMEGYGREIATVAGVAAEMLLLNETLIGDKTTLLRLYVQNGIDYYFALEGGSSWPGNGGHASGRKYQILFAGLMLGDSNMLSIGNKYPPSSDSFGEDSQTLYITYQHTQTQLDVMISGPTVSATATSITVTGLPRYTRLKGNYIEITDGPGTGQRRYISESDEPWGDTAHLPVVATISEPWEIVPVAGESIYQVIGFEAHHIGLPEWTGISPTDYPERLNPTWFYPYRECCNALSWHGSILAARALGLKRAWNNTALFDYQDRYMQVTSPTGEHPGWRSSSRFTEDMWDMYRSQFGCVYAGLNQGSHKRIYDCAGQTFDCTSVSSCTQYSGSQMASNEDPCELGCSVSG